LDTLVKLFEEPELWTRIMREEHLENQKSPGGRISLNSGGWLPGGHLKSGDRAQLLN
jgi:hypothetical protein